MTRPLAEIEREIVAALRRLRALLDERQAALKAARYRRYKARPGWYAAVLAGNASRYRARRGRADA